MTTSDRPLRGPVQETRIDQRVEHEATVVGTDVPEARGLAERQFHRRRFLEIGADPVYDVCVSHAPTGASGTPSATLVPFPLISLPYRELHRSWRSAAVAGDDTYSSDS